MPFQAGDGSVKGAVVNCTPPTAALLQRTGHVEPCYPLLRARSARSRAPRGYPVRGGGLLGCGIYC